MNDLTNKTTQEIESLINKYNVILNSIKLDKSKLSLFVVILDYAVKYIENKYSNLNSELKAWCCVVIKKFFEFNKINCSDDIVKIIDDFIFFWEKEYQNFCDNTITLTSNNFDKDLNFIYLYIQKK